MELKNINQIIVNDDNSSNKQINYNNNKLIYTILKTHLKLINSSIVDPVMNVDNYLQMATDSALRLVVQLHRFKSHYLLIQELDKKHNEICDLKIDGLIISADKEKKIKDRSITKVSSCDINIIGCDACSCNDRIPFSEHIYENIMKMYNEYYKYEKKNIYLNIPSNEMMQRYQEVVQLYEIEETNLYNCMNDFNLQMSQYLIVNNKEKIKSKFMNGLIQD
jgi:hypothetical protein